MSTVIHQSDRFFQSWIRYIPGFVLGLFVGRLVSEWLRPSLVGAVLITLFSLAIFTIVFSRFPVRRTWPLLFLLLYVLFPEVDPRILLASILLCLVAFVANWLIPDRETNRSTTYVYLAAILIITLFTWLYLNTIAPDILPADSGEFQLMASQLGIPHPPGFALYTILGHMMTRLPFNATNAFKVNLLSILLALATLIVVYSAVYLATRHVLAGLAASVALGVSTTFWAQATTANIRMMTTFFAAFILLAAVKLLNLQDTEDAADHTQNPQQPSLSPDARRWLILLVLALGLGIGHHLSLAFLGLIVAILVFYSYRFIFRQPGTLLVLLAVGVLSLAPLIYIPLRVAASAMGSSPELLTLRGFLNHILALGFQGDLFYVNNPGIIWERLKVIGNVATFQFPILTLIAIVLGLGIALRRDRKLGIILAGSLVVYVLVAASYRAPQTVEYLMPAYVLGVMAIGYLVGPFIDAGHSVEEGSLKRPVLMVLGISTIAVLLVTSFNEAVDNYPSYAFLHGDRSTREYVQSLLVEAPPESVILADWHWVTPLWYLQEIEGLRNDVRIEFVFPTGEKYADTWARRIREELADDHPVIASHFDEAAYQDLPVTLPFYEAYLFDRDPVTTLPADFEPLQLNFGGDFRLMGYRLEDQSLTAADEIVLDLAWERSDAGTTPLNLYAHLISPDGQRAGQDDQAAIVRDIGISFTQLRLYPTAGVTPGDYELRVGAYDQEPIADQDGQIGTPITTLTIGPTSFSPATRNKSYRPLAASPTGRRLIGYDADSTLEDQLRLYLHWQDDAGYVTEAVDLDDLTYSLPDWIGPWGQRIRGSLIELDQDSFYVPFAQGIVWTGPVISDSKLVVRDHEFPITNNFLSSYPVLRDLVVSVRLVGYQDDGFHWAWWDLSDNVPALGAIPTLKWIANSDVRDPHWPVVDPDAISGQEVEPLLRLYDAFTGRPLQILDERLTQLAPWIPLGRATVE